MISKCYYNSNLPNLETKLIRHLKMISGVRERLNTISVNCSREEFRSRKES